MAVDESSSKQTYFVNDYNYEKHKRLSVISQEDNLSRLKEVSINLFKL